MQMVEIKLVTNILFVKNQLKMLSTSELYEWFRGIFNHMFVNHFRRKFER